MLMKRLVLFLVGMFMLAACQNLGTDRSTAALETDSWRVLPVTRFSNIVNSARADNKTWINSPSLFAFNLLNLSEIKHYRIDSSLDNSESATQGTLLVERDGFVDDSVRGDVHSFKLKKIGGQWQVVQVKHAVRCWRIKQDRYANQTCP